MGSAWRAASDAKRRLAWSSVTAGPDSEAVYVASSPTASAFTVSALTVVSAFTVSAVTVSACSVNFVARSVFDS